MMPNQTKAARPTAGFIYVLKPRALLNEQEVIKIGMTTRSVAKRVRELSTGSMIGFDVAYSLRVENARELEKKLHNRFRRFRVHGGGQEFFSVKADEVVKEIERIATEVSKERARFARDQEISLFKKQLGASDIERMIAVPILFLHIIVWCASSYLAYLFVEVTVGTGWAITAGVAVAFFGYPLGIGKIVQHFEEWLRSRFFEPRFGARIRAKEDELRIKYPLAYVF
jgi:hypothetical protein